MIAIDSSALIAILQSEPERAMFASIIAHASQKFVCAVTFLEAGMIAYSRRGQAGLEALSDIVADAEIEIVPFDAALARLALEAFERYGKGNHSKARLNLGDCAAYALAKSKNLPLLYKGTDFASTDIASAAA
jgi:ribonuclease VapC